MHSMTRDSAVWLGGLLDGFGEIAWRGAGPVVRFKTAFPDRLHAIERALDGTTRTRKFQISGDSRRPQWIIEIRGAEFFMLMNAVAQFMRTQKRVRFDLQFGRWQRLVAGRAIKKADGHEATT